MEIMAKHIVSANVSAEMNVLNRRTGFDIIEILRTADAWQIIIERYNPEKNGMI